MATATYSKLRTGEWGVRLVGKDAADWKAGAIVTVVKKSGDEKEERIGRKVWSGDDVALYTIDSAPSRGRYSSYPRTGCSCGSRDGIVQDSDCWTCKHDA